MQSTAKPLPAIPAGLGRSSTNEIPDLTPPARDHLRKIITQALVEEGLSTSWALHILTAVQDIGHTLSKKHALSGLKRNKQYRSQKAREIDDNAIVRPKGKSRTPEDDPEKAENKGVLDGVSRSPKSRRTRARENAEIHARALAALLHLTSSSAASSSSPTRSHLLITLSPQSHIHRWGYEEKCIFVPGKFALPTFELEGVPMGSGGVDIYGVESLKSLFQEEHVRPTDSLILLDVLVVGGTFNVTGLPPQKYDSFAKVLRLTVYSYLSNVLEICFLKDSGVELVYPLSPDLPKIPLPELPDPRYSISSSSTGPPASPASNRLSGGLWSFITKKTSEFTGKHIRTRSKPFATEFPEPSLPALANRQATPPVSSARQNDLMLRVNSSPGGAPSNPFATALKGIRSEASIFSTSHSVKFEAPEILVRLAREEGDPASFSGSDSALLSSRPKRRKRISGPDKAALSSILGWKNDGSGTGFGGVSGFIRHQSITVLYVAPPAIERPPTGKASRPTTPGLPSTPPPPPRWRDYHFYDSSEPTLGMWIEEVSAYSEDAFWRDPGRDPLNYSWAHAGMILSGEVTSNFDDIGAPRSGIEIYFSCTACETRSKRMNMGDGAYLLDFGKFLELTFYSNEMHRLSHSICDHTRVPPGASVTGSSKSKFFLTRNFSCGRSTVSLRLSTVDDIFDVRVPRCQAVRTLNEVARKAVPSSEDEEWLRSERDRLRLDMTFAWKGLKDHLRWLEDSSTESSSSSGHKRLPTTPLFSESPEESLTPTQHTSHINDVTDSSFHASISLASGSEHTHSSHAQSTSSVSSTALSGLRGLIASAEHTLYIQLAESSLNSLSDVRRAFMSSASDTFQRLNQHTPFDRQDSLRDVLTTLPEWWKDGIHCLPNSGVIVRETEWGSIIAFTLRSSEFRGELEDMAQNPTLSAASGEALTPSKHPFSRKGSFPWRSVSNPSTPSTQPNGFSYSPAGRASETNLILHAEPEDFSAIISRKENPRDLSSLLSIRDVLLHRRSIDTSASSSKFGSLGSTASKVMGFAPPPAAWAKPNVQISLQVAGGEVLGNSQLEVESKVVDQLELSGVETVDFESKLDTSPAELLPQSEPPPSSYRPPKSNLQQERSTAEGGTQVIGASKITSHRVDSSGSTFSSAMRYLMNPLSGTAGSEAAYDDTAHRLALLSLDQGAPHPRIDARPHLQYDFTVGNRLRFSCTSYYALQFSNLRKQCGIEDTFLRSMERTTSWLADGGKSKSTFFKTLDERFILKTLVTAWNVADLQALLELAPSYFGYINQTLDKPSALAKLLGFYTIEIKNLETGATESKADILVMENIFYSQTVDATYDLKGIKGRKTKGEATPSRTHFDQEWIDYQRRSPLYISPRSKHVLQEALTYDTEFLSSNNVMDYSLLVGIDQKLKEVVCGVVDTFGTYNLAKTLESKAKQGLTSKEKEVTVIPPSEYRARFLKAMDQYFVSIPDKWSRPSVGMGTTDFFRAMQIL